MGNKWDNKVKKFDEFVYVVDKEGTMNVPVKIFASEKLLKKMN